MFVCVAIGKTFVHFSLLQLVLVRECQKSNIQKNLTDRTLFPNCAVRGTIVKGMVKLKVSRTEE